MLGGAEVRSNPKDTSLPMSHRCCLLLLVLGVGVASSLRAEEPGTTRVARWHDDKAGAFVLMFDDSIPSHLKNAVPELTKRGFTGTFYINPGAGHFAGKREAWEKTIPAAGFELANHTMTHRGGPTAAAIATEIRDCNAAIHAATPDLPWPRLVSWGQPGGIKKENWPVTKEELAALLAENHLVSRPDFGGRGAMIAFKTAPDMLAHVDQAIAKGSLECIIFHGVGGEWLSTPLPVFIELLDGMVARQDKLWITHHISAHQYATERDAATVSVASRNETEIRLSLACTADPALYSQPLTLVTVVPAVWTTCRVQQGDLQQDVKVVDGRIRYDALPGDQPIVVTAE